MTGLNNNAFQIKRGEEMNKATGRHENCDFVKADFMKIPKPDASFDAVYQIEATCHAPDAVGCYSEIFRVLKPGGVFASYEWCLTDAYDPTNAEHRRIRQEILIGNGLPTARTCEDVLTAMKKAGSGDSGGAGFGENRGHLFGYEPIDPYRAWRPWRDFWSFKTTIWGRAVTHYLVWFLETVGIAPKGSMGVSGFLKKGADGLVAGGKAGIYTVSCTSPPRANR